MADFSMGLIALLSQLLRIARPETREQIFTEYKNLAYSNRNRKAISTATWIGIAFQERKNFLEIRAEEKSIQSPFAESKRLPEVKPRCEMEFT
jgi:hypothetical protein